MKTTLSAFLIVMAIVLSPASAQNIPDLSEHFDDPGGDYSPWMFVPEENIKDISLSEVPGLATIWQAGKGKDIKGILEEPIRIDDYPPPWDFQLGLAQNYNATLFGLGDRHQNNYAIGFNVALTFSDPSTWPEDRTEKPSETYSFQLFVVHLGSTSEFDTGGLPQYAPHRFPEHFLVWGRGDLVEHVKTYGEMSKPMDITGDWGIPWIWTGTMPVKGPASHRDFFRFFVSNRTNLGIGIKFDESHDYMMRYIDCSPLGPITGIWEIGPIFSCDRWIPDELCPQLPILKEVPDPPKPKAPNPVFSFYVDYCTFLRSYPHAPFEHYSDDFDIPGYLGQWRGFQLPFSAETWSNPGNLTITLLGPSQGCWFGPLTLLEIDFDHYSPPWEMEACFTAPDDSVPWNFFFHHQLWDAEGNMRGYWQPGVVNDPSGKGLHYSDTYRIHGDGKIIGEENLYFYLESFGENHPKDSRPIVHIEFEEPVPKEILSHKPLYMLYRMVDHKNVRIGFKARDEDPWYLSKPYDLTKALEGGAGKIGEACWGTAIGRDWACPPGSPMFQKLLVDHIRYRKGLSE